MQLVYAMDIAVPVRPPVASERHPVSMVVVEVAAAMLMGGRAEREEQLLNMEVKLTPSAVFISGMDASEVHP